MNNPYQLTFETEFVGATLWAGVEKATVSVRTKFVDESLQPSRNGNADGSRVQRIVCNPYWSMMNRIIQRAESELTAHVPRFQTLDNFGRYSWGFQLHGDISKEPDIWNIVRAIATDERSALYERLHALTGRIAEARVLDAKDPLPPLQWLAV